MRALTDIPREWIDPGDLKKASDIQRHLAAMVSMVDEPMPRCLAGADISNAPRDPHALMHAVVVPLAPRTLLPLQPACSSLAPRFPYVSGFLGFREIPALIDCFRILHDRGDAMPDLVFVDGHGISHPRGLGIAAHLGVVLDLPTIGVAKTILVGQPDGILGDAAGSRVKLVWKGREIGAVIRTKPRVNPVYVSVGHRVSLDAAVEHVLAATRRHRLPEPTRHAHLAANSWRRQQDGVASTPIRTLAH